MTDDLQQTLKPCPFCKTVGAPKFHKGKGVKCHTCGAWGPSLDEGNADLWNERYGLAAEVLRLRKQVAAGESVVAAAGHARLALAGYVSAQSALDKLDAALAVYAEAKGE